MKRGDRVLLLYLEPTPYILGFLKELHLQSPWPIEVWFLGQNLSQDWRLELPAYGRVVGGGAAGALREIWHALREPGVGLLHLCGWGGHGALTLSILIASLRGIPVVVESDTQAPFVSSPLRRAAKGVLYPALFQLPRMFLPGGTRQRSYLRGYGVPDSKLRIAQMTVDVASIMHFAQSFDAPRRAAWRTAHGVDDRTALFLFVGRLEKYKGLRSLLSAFHELAKTGLSVCLVVVGDGALRDDVKRAAAESDRIIACGRLQGDDLCSAYCAADVFVLPSAFEPWGLVINEAMACGLPIIASDRVGCVDDLVNDQDTGIVYPQADSGRLVEAMRLLSNDPEVRARMSGNAKRVISGWTLREEATRVVAAWMAAA